MINAPAATPPPKIQRMSVKNWESGYNSTLDDGRTPNNGLSIADNIILTQDGTPGPRQSLILYGVQPTGTVLGEIYEFVKNSGLTRERWLITVQNIAGTASVCIAKDGGSWTVCTGKTYNTTASCHFLQVDDKVLIMNGVDNLSYLDIATSTVVPFTALSTPDAPTITRTGLSGTAYTYYYKITANSTVGETAASNSTSQQVSAIRGAWDTTANYLKVSWSAVASAKSYNIYIAEVSTGPFNLIATVNGLEYFDYGAAAPDYTRQAPVGDSTAGPKVTRGSYINGQVFLTGDADNTRYVRYGGTGDSVLDFSPYGGGGWVEVGRGSKELPERVISFRDGRGNPVTTVLCQGTNGSGKRYTLTSESQTIGDTIITYFRVDEDNGQDGTDSPDGVVLYNDSLWYPSKDGFKTTGTKPQLQNILSTSTVSQTIEQDIHSLNVASMNKCVGLAYEGRIYWALPVGSDTNNRVWVLDVRRKGAWMTGWMMDVDWMTLYDDNTGVTHFLVLSDNQILEFTSARQTNDNGTAFRTRLASGVIRFSEDGMDWWKVIDMTFVLLRPRGNITITVTGMTEDGAISQVHSGTYNTNSGIYGWGEAGWGSSGWSHAPESVEIESTVREVIPIEVGEEYNWYSWEINTSDTGVEYQLSDLVVRGVNIGTKDLS